MAEASLRQSLDTILSAEYEPAPKIKQRDIGPVIGNAIHDELNAILLRWLKYNPPIDISTHMSSETMAEEVVTMLMDGIANQLPDS